MFALDNSSVLKLRPSIALVYTKNTLEMFKTNLRESVKIRIYIDNIVDIFTIFNGGRSISDILCCSKHPKTDTRIIFVAFTVPYKNNILIVIETPYNNEVLSRYGKVILTIEEYYKSTSDVEKAFLKLQNATVLIVGIGTVGTWVAKSLAMSGVKKFILVDPDIVSESNLHRQELFFESDINSFKINITAERLLEMDNSNRKD